MRDYKLIYKYTHAEAVAGGELRLLDPRCLRDLMTMPIYVGHQLDPQLQRCGISDDQLYGAIHRAFEDRRWKYSSGRRYTVCELPVPFDIVPGEQIGDDDNRDEGDEIITCVLPGES